MSDVNAYGGVVAVELLDGKVLPVICGHGGSMWLCDRCALDCLTDPKYRKASDDERRQLRERLDEDLR